MIALTMLWLFRLLSSLLVVFTLLPLARTGWWFARGWDFPRLQMGVIALVLLIAGGVAAALHWRTEFAVVLPLLLVIAAWQWSHVLPYTSLWPTQVPDATSIRARGPRSGVRVVIANLRVDNDQHDAVRARLAELEADVLVLIELDDTWAQALEPLTETFTHRRGITRGEGLGLAVWSRLPMRDTRVEHLVSDRRASVFTTLTWPNGERVHFVAVHPTPPGLRDSTGEGRRDSRVRDAELIRVARHIAEHDDGHWIVAGDFNDVAWSHTTRLFKRLSGLVDPRVGRCLLDSYHAEYPLLRYPLDHVFVSHGFSVARISRHRTPGSDHFAVLADLVMSNDHGAKPQPRGDDQREAREIVEEGQQDAAQRDVLASPD